jgi:hypothetical protein
LGISLPYLQGTRAKRARRGILGKNDLASRPIDLAELARAVALMPTLLEAEQVDVEPKSTAHVSNEEHGTRIYHR